MKECVDKMKVTGRWQFPEELLQVGRAREASGLASGLAWPLLHLGLQAQRLASC
jgi:hypothetical protein